MARRRAIAGWRGAGTHRLAVVRVQYQATGIDISIPAGLGDEIGGDPGRVAIGDSPPDNTAGPDIHHQIQVKIDSTDIGREPRDVPTPDLIGPHSAMHRAGTGFNSNLPGLRAADSTVKRPRMARVFRFGSTLRSQISASPCLQS